MSSPPEYQRSKLAARIQCAPLRIAPCSPAQFRDQPTAKSETWLGKPLDHSRVNPDTGLSESEVCFRQALRLQAARYQSPGMRVLREKQRCPMASPGIHGRTFLEHFSCWFLRLHWQTPVSFGASSCYQRSDERNKLTFRLMPLVPQRAVRQGRAVIHCGAGRSCRLSAGRRWIASSC